MSDCCAYDHGGAEDDENPAVSFRLRDARRSTKVVISREDLDQDGSQLSRSSADAMAGATVAGGEYFSRNHVCCGIGACRVQSV